MVGTNVCVCVCVSHNSDPSSPSPGEDVIVPACGWNHLMALKSWILTVYPHVVNTHACTCTHRPGSDTYELRNFDLLRTVDRLPSICSTRRSFQNDMLYAYSTLVRYMNPVSGDQTAKPLTTNDQTTDTVTNIHPPKRPSLQCTSVQDMSKEAFQLWVDSRTGV